MGGIDLMDQPKSAYQLDQRSKFRSYFRFFFNLFNVALVNSFIVYKKFENKDLIWYAWHRNWSLLSSAQNYFVLIIVHPSTPKLKDCPDIPIAFANFLGNKTTLYPPKQEKKTEHLLRTHYVM